MPWRRVVHLLLALLAQGCACGSTNTSANPSTDASADVAADARPPFDADLCGRLRELARAYVAANHAPGVVFRAELRNGAVCSGAAGLADLASATPMTEDARFRIGSVTKTFVAAVVLELVDETKVALADKVSRFLPTFPRPDVTVEQLLNHTSGLVDYLFDPTLQSTQDKAHGIDELLAVAANVQSGAKPPGSWAYSNTNYLLLGKIIDVASGSTWPQEVRRRILDPMGLSATFVYGFEPVVGDFVKGYEDDGAGWSDMTGRTHPTVMNAAGCMISSMRDLGRFWRALNEGQILSPTMLDAMRTRSVPVVQGQRWGLGVESQDGGSLGTLYGHGGGFGGYSTQMQYFAGPDATLTVAVNASIANGDPLELVDPQTQVHKGIRPQLWRAILRL